MTAVRRDSPYQIAIFDAIKNTNSNVAVLATAGSGKTTTILKGLHFIPKIKKNIFLSFASAIVEELRSKVPAHVEAATLHSIGFGFVRRYYGGSFHIVKEGRFFSPAINLYKEAKGGERIDKKEYRGAALVSEICNYARMTLTSNNALDLQTMCSHFNIDWEPQIIEYAVKLLIDATKIKKYKHVWQIDYVDMIYLPVKIEGMVDKAYDNVFLDEAQDTNACQLQLLELILNKESGRLISVGDDFQCIYGFAGADTDAFKRIRERPNTVTLPLSVSYRCPKSVVKKAQEVCPSIEAWQDAEEGEERMGDWSEITETDMVLSRTTKPLVSLYFKLIEKGIRARIIGKDIEAGLIDLLDKCMSESLEGITYKLNLQFDELEKDLKALGVRVITEHPRWRALTEKVQVLGIIIKQVSSPSQLMPAVHEMFNQKKEAAKLMTIHRSKGLECNRVFVIHKAGGAPLMPSKWAKQDWEHIQERNLQFVAFTRSKKDLIHIELTEQ